jgi:hypothetical protein
MARIFPPLNSGSDATIANSRKLVILLLLLALQLGLKHDLLRRLRIEKPVRDNGLMEQPDLQS